MFSVDSIILFVCFFSRLCKFFFSLFKQFSFFFAALAGLLNGAKWRRNDRRCQYIARVLLFSALILRQGVVLVTQRQFWGLHLRVLKVKSAAAPVAHLLERTFILFPETTFFYIFTLFRSKFQRDFIISIKTFGPRLVHHCWAAWS